MQADPLYLPYDLEDELSCWWLADPLQPHRIGALRLVQRTAQHPRGVSLTYADEWLAHGFALSEDLPLLRGVFFPSEQDTAAGAVDDARPDRWGERVIRVLDKPPRLSTLEYLFFAGDDRFGALGVSASLERYQPRSPGPLPTFGDIGTIHDLALRILSSEPIAPALRRLISPGVSLGGARPKALVAADGVQWVVKFAEPGDYFDTPLVEHATMTLARQAGIDTADSMAVPLARGHAIAVRRFDRQGGRRRHALSAQVALRAASSDLGYPDLALLLRRKGAAERLRQDCAELFRRMIFNILMDNTDDHEKNHCVLMRDDGQFVLSPAYDVVPSGHSLGYQQFRVGLQQSDSTIENALSEAASFGLSTALAQVEVRRVAQAASQWKSHFAQAGVSAQDIATLEAHIDRPFLREQRQAWITSGA